MVLLAGYMNGHVGSSNSGYDGTHGGFGYGDRNADGSRILEFADGVNLLICNTLFMKQESKPVTYVAGSVKSTVVVCKLLDLGHAGLGHAELGQQDWDMRNWDSATGTVFIV